MTFSEQLGRELTAVGITGRRRARILAEIEDHLACDPGAQLGEPAQLAAQFADELGTCLARRAALHAFGALALAGVLFAVAVIAGPAGLFATPPLDSSLTARLSRIAAVLAPQVAFAAGVLAALRAVHRRRQPVIPAAEAVLLVRRAWVAVCFGLLAMVALAGIALSLGRHVSGAWQTYTLIASAVGVAAMLAIAPSLWAADRLRPVARGSAGDVFDDVGRFVPASWRGHPWRFAVAVSLLVGAAVTLAGVAAHDAYDGGLRGLADGLACLGGFATLGRFLGLWSPRHREPGPATRA